MINQMWEPLWKNKASKLVSKDELTALERLESIIRDKNIVIEPVLDIGGDKVLRFKKKYKKTLDIDLYDYVLLGPVLFKDRKIFCRQAYTMGRSGNHAPTVSLTMDEDEIAINAVESLFNTKALREARQNSSVLKRLYDKNS